MKFLKIFLTIIFLNFDSLSSKEFITLQSTTSTRDSGLYEYLLPKFTEKYGFDVRVVAVGTGQALKNAKKCDADVLIVHHKKSEEKFVKDGFGLFRKVFMYMDSKGKKFCRNPAIKHFKLADPGPGCLNT